MQNSTQPTEHPENLRRRVVALFFSGLLLMAVFAIWLGWACADWGRFSLIYVHETRELAERFGDAYREYKKRTPFLLSRFRYPR